MSQSRLPSGQAGHGLVWTIALSLVLIAACTAYGQTADTPTPSSSSADVSAMAEQIKQLQRSMAIQYLHQAMTRCSR